MGKTLLSLIFCMGLLSVVQADALDFDSTEVLCQFAIKGDGGSIYHSNGNVFTHNAGKVGASWYYPNGNVITHNAGKKGASWYYSNGNVLTHNAGKKGASWYWPNGNVITHNAGKKGASWYHDNGSVLTHRGPDLTEEELTYPCSFLQ